MSASSRQVSVLARVRWRAEIAPPANAHPCFIYTPFTGEMQRLCKQQKSTGFWQAADKQINVRRCVVGGTLLRLLLQRLLLRLLQMLSFARPHAPFTCAQASETPPTTNPTHHQPNRSRGGSGPKRRVATMMPVAAPKVLVRPPGQRQFEWVDMWEAYVSHRLTVEPLVLSVVVGWGRGCVLATAGPSIGPGAVGAVNK